MDITTSPVARRRRLPHGKPSSIATSIVEEAPALAATFLLALSWFGKVVAPTMAELVPPALEPPVRANPLSFSSGLALATGIPTAHLKIDDRKLPPLPTSPTWQPADVQSFVVTCALVHTLLVCVGFAFGRDTLAGAGRKPSEPLILAGLASFCVLCAALWCAWEFEVGPVPRLVRLLTENEAAFVLIGAGSATLWIGASMLLQHSPLGRSSIGSRRFCALAGVLGGSMLLLDASAGGGLTCFGLCAFLLVSAAIAEPPSSRSPLPRAASFSL